MTSPAAGPTAHAARAAPRRLRRCTTVAAAAVLALAAAAAHAQVGGGTPDSGMDLQFRLGVIHSDNVGRDELGESRTYGYLGTDLDLRRSGPRLEARLGGNLDFHRYGSSVYDDEVVGNVAGLLGFAVVPQRFDWIVQNDFGSVRSDPFRSTGPDNREYLNRFSTGPDLHLPLGERMTLGAGGRYTDRRWQDSTRLDSSVVSGNVSLFRLLRRTQRVGVVASAQSVDYDLPGLPSYDIYSAYATYSRTLPSGSAGLSVGANRVDFAGTSRSGALLRGDWSRQLTGRSTLSLNAGREFQDSGDQFASRRVARERFDDTGDIPLASDPLTRSRLGAGYTLRGNRATWTLNGGWSRDSYEQSTSLDRDSWNARAGVNVRMTPQLSGSLGAALRHERFDADVPSADDWRLTAGLTRRLGRELDAALRYEHHRRDGGRREDVSENRGVLSLVWVPGRR